MSHHDPESRLPAYLAGLNPAQLEAVRHEGSPLLILAGAGSGKTRVITTKIAWLVRERNVEPESILAVTFTNKAAREMRDRATALEPACGRSVLRTFHSFGAWFLRRNALQAGLDPAFVIYDDEDSAALLHSAMPRYTKKECSRFCTSIARAKDLGLECDSPSLDAVSTDPEFRRIFTIYQERLRRTGNVDFGDLIRLPLQVLAGDDIIRRRTRQRFRTVLVDEYQDSNVSQFRLLKALAGEDTYVCAVGDDDQSIYRFRGAEIRNILEFPDSFPGTTIIRLERNYRSYQSILDVAGDVVARNAGRLGKRLEAVRTGGSKPVFALVDDQEAEAAYCGRVIGEHRAQGGRYSDVAILYRTNAQSLAFEKAFPRSGIPYRIVGALRFYEREEIKDMLAWLSFIQNPRDEVSFRRIANKPVRGLGDSALESIVDHAGRTGSDLLVASREKEPVLKGRARSGIREFLSLMDEFRAVPDMVDADQERTGTSPYSISDGGSAPVDPGSASLGAFVQTIATRSGMVDFHRSQDEVAGTQKLANIEELVNAASLYPFSRGGLADFLETIELDRSLSSGEDRSDAVTLITIHNTKGLEFPVVVVTGLEQGLFPRDDDEGEDLEEQRRLFYVAMTRAKDVLHLTACSWRSLHGRLFQCSPSRFLSEIAPGRLASSSRPDRPGAHSSGFVGSRVPAMSGGSGPGERRPGSGRPEVPWRAGTSVYHDEYGPGIITKVSPTPSAGPLLVVRFESGRQAQFFPKFTTKLIRQEP